MALQKRPFKKVGTCANPLCGKQFIRTRRNQQYCCLSCASKHNKMKQGGKPRKEYKPKFCEWCDTWFTPTTTGQKYCCETCAREAAEYKARKRMWKKLHPDKPAPDPEPSNATYIKNQKKTAPTMKQVLDYMYKHNCQYRRAIQEMEAGNQ